MPKTITNDLLLAKVVSMAILGICSFLLGIAPLAFAKRLTTITPHHHHTNKSLIISLLLCFGGGVLLFTTFLHLQPEVRESFAALESSGQIHTIFTSYGLPLSEIVLCCGFFLVYLIEELVHVWLDRKIHSNNNSRGGKGNLVKNLEEHHHHHNSDSRSWLPRVKLDTTINSSISCISASNKELLNSQMISGSLASTASSGNHSHLHLDDETKNSFGGLVAVLALSFHAVFEGLAVGLEGGVQRVWYLLMAIATHKLVIAFCVGVELVTSKTRMVLVFVYMGTFALVTPLGLSKI